MGRYIFLLPRCIGDISDRVDAAFHNDRRCIATKEYREGEKEKERFVKEIVARNFLRIQRRSLSNNRVKRENDMKKLRSEIC